jgi:tetratricopeptide (TPR) repeat protein
MSLANSPSRLGQAYYAIGDFGRAAELLRWNVEAADRASGTPSTLRFESRAWLARTLSALGAFAEGRCHGEEALRLATLAGRGAIPTVTYGCLGHLYLAQGDLEHAIQVLEQGLALCRASGGRDWLTGIVAGLGYAYALQGRLAEGHALLEKAISESLRMGTRHSPNWVAWLSEVCRLAGRGEEAGQPARQALDLARQQKASGHEAHALHQLGVVHAHTAPPMLRRPKPITSRPWPSPTSSACARSWPTVTWAWAPYTLPPASGSRPAPPWLPPSRCIAPWR